MNAYFIIPILIHILIDKLHPDKLAKHDDLKINIIHILTRVAYGMRKTPSVQIHPTVYNYCAAANDTKFTQGLDSDYVVIPVTVFLLTLYNASFMFDDNKSKNLLISALGRFDLGSTVGDATILNTLSKFTYKKYVNFKTRKSRSI